MADVDELKRLLVDASRVISTEGLAEAYGHVSARIPGTELFLMPGLSSPGLVTYDNILTFDMNARKVEGTGQPMNEVWLHACVYRLRPDVNAVAHTHSTMVVILSTLGQVVRPLHNSSMNSVRFTNVQLFQRPGLINTEELGMAAARTLGQEPAVMLRGHGANIVGASIVEATLSAIFLEESAKMQVWATALGQPQFFTAEEFKNFPARLEAQPQQLKRAWDFYMDRVRRATALPPA